MSRLIELSYYLCPERKISFDGFVHYDGRRFGVPYWYTEKTCHVKRDGYILYVYDSKMTKVLTTHDVTWSRRDSFCKDQYVAEQPEEKPTAPVRVHIQQFDPPQYDFGFSRFKFHGKQTDARKYGQESSTINGLIKSSWSYFDTYFST